MMVGSHCKLKMNALSRCCFKVRSFELRINSPERQMIRWGYPNDPRDPPLPLFGSPELEAMLARIARSVHADLHTRQDLEQEVRLHFWRKQIERQGQTLSWYLQSCRFRLQACLRRG